MYWLTFSRSKPEFSPRCHVQPFTSLRRRSYNLNVSQKPVRKLVRLLKRYGHNVRILSPHPFGMIFRRCPGPESMLISFYERRFYVLHWVQAKHPKWLLIWRKHMGHRGNSLWRHTTSRENTPLDIRKYDDNTPTNIVNANIFTVSGPGTLLTLNALPFPASTTKFNLPHKSP